MGMLIRKFQKGDEHRISQIVIDCLDNVLTKNSEQLEIEKFKEYYTPDNILIRSYEENIFLAYDSIIKGVIGIKENTITLFYVDPRFMGKGIGRSLFEHVKQEIIKKRYEKIDTGSSLYAVPVYERFGFKILNFVFIIFVNDKRSRRKIR